MAGVVSGSTLTLYVDGKALSPTMTPGPVVAYAASNFYIGTYSGEYFSGSLDSIEVYAKSLVASDIQKIYAEGLRDHTFAQN